MKRIISVLLAGVLVFSSLLTGCGSEKTAADEPTKRDSIVIGLTGEPAGLDTQLLDDGNARNVTYNIFETLTNLDPKTLEPIPALATEFKNVDPNTWEFTIREGVKFHSGDVLTAEDVAYSINRVLDPALKSAVTGWIDTVKEAKTTSDNKVQIVTNGPDPLLTKRLTLIPIYSKAYTEANADAIVSSPNGTGPYKFVEWNQGSDIKLVKNDEYWGTKPTITNATFRFIKETATALAALKAGEIDFAFNMYPEYINELPKVATVSGNEGFALRINRLRGPLVNKDLALAINYAIDVPSLINNLYQGQGTQFQGQLAKDSYFGYSDQVTAYPYDKAKAQELIKKSGYNGEVIEFIGERGRWQKDGELVEAIAAMLTDAGLNVKVKFVSWQEYLDIILNQDKASSLQLTAIGNDFFDLDRVYSSIVASKAPISNYSNPQADQLIAEARQELDATKRQAIYDQLAKLVYDDPYGVPLFSIKEIYGLAADVNYTPREDARVYVSDISFAETE